MSSQLADATSAAPTTSAQTQTHRRLEALERTTKQIDQNQFFMFLGGACIGGAVVAILNTWGANSGGGGNLNAK